MTSTHNDLVQQEQLALLRLHRLHRRIAQIKSKSNAWIVPILLGAACSFVAFALLGVTGSLIESLVREKLPVGIVAPLGILALIIPWVFGTRFFRRRARRKSLVLVLEAEAALKKAVEEVKEHLPQWTEEMGGEAALLDSARVTDALIVAHQAPAADLALTSSEPPLSPAGSGGRGVTGQYVKYRSPAAIYPLVIVTVGVYLFVWVYKIHSEVRHHLGAERTIGPGLAMGLLFIPIFSSVWIIILLHKVASLSNEVLRERGTTPVVGTGGILVLLIIGQVFALGSFVNPSVALLSIPLIWIAIAKVQSNLNRAWQAQGLIAFPL